VPHPFASSKSRSLGLAAPAIALALVLALPRPAGAFDAEHPENNGQAAPAPEAGTEQQLSLSDVASEALGKLKPLVDEKNWPAALKVLDDLTPKLAPDSYDLAVVLDTKAKILLQLSDYPGTIEPLETALRLGQAHHYFTPKEITDRLFLLAQIDYQESANDKAHPDKEIRERYLEQAVETIERCIASSAKPSAEVSEFYARVLYDEAVAKNPAKPDPVLLKKCQDQAEKIIATTLHPKDVIYVLLLDTFLQQANYTRSAELLELLVSREPGASSKVYWEQLEGLYVTLASSAEQAAVAADKKSSPVEKQPALPRAVKKYYARAINAIERAQEHGFLSTTKDNYDLVTIYYTVEQFGKATDLLHAGLESGAIKSEIKNWELLASSYQQINQQSKAIEALKEAALDPQFADNGQIDFQIGQMYSELNKTADAYAHFKTAVHKTGLDHPIAVYLYLAYSAFELQKYDEALDAVDHAAKLPDAAKDKQLGPLRQAVLDAIKAREQQKQAVSRTSF